MRLRCAVTYLLTAACGLLLCGCGFDGEMARREHAELFQRNSLELTERALAGREALNLEDCLDIALRNSLQVRLAEIEARIAQLERRAAFSMFLPVVEASASFTTMGHAPMMRAGEDPAGNSLFMQARDKDVRTAAVQIQQPIFHPSVWFLYAARERGEEIGDLLLDFAQQRIRMEVTAQYFQCLSLHEAGLSARSQLEVGKQVLTETEARHAEGLAEDWQVEEARLLLLARDVELEQSQRTEETAKAGLMSLMGLSPLVAYNLAASEPLEPPEGDVAEMILQALLNHPQLHISDRMVAIGREQVKTAISSFLPGLGNSFTLSYSTDSFLKYATSWTYGVGAILSVFNGFANVQQYRIARAREEESWVRREEACLAVMLQVIRARASLRDAEQGAELARKALDVSESRFRVTEAKWREGLASPTELLAGIAARDSASSNHTMADFRRQVCVAALLHAIGKNVGTIKEERFNEK